MLVIERDVSTWVEIILEDGRRIRLNVASVKCGEVRSAKLAFEAPRTIKILRSELLREDAAATDAALLAERDRLRSALEEVVLCCHCDYCTRIARTALEGVQTDG